MSARAAGVTLRRARPADAPRLAELAEAAYGPYVERIGGRPRPMDDDYAEVIGEHVVTVAELDGDVVGIVVLAAEEDGMLLDNLAVDPARQGRGIGRMLIEHAEGEARRRGLESIRLFTHELMHENLALYERRGYFEYERRRLDDAHCLVFMRKPLR